MPLIQHEIDNGIALVTLNRPLRHNALVPELLSAFREAIVACARAAPAAVIVAANGRSFSTGGDVGAFHDTPRPQRPAYARDIVGELNAAIVDLLRLPSPTLVAVHGAVTGGAIGLVLACDLVLADSSASFAPWYTAVGFSPDGGWTALMPERVGRARALEIQLLNRQVKADEALRLGLVQKLVSGSSVVDAARATARQLQSAQAGSIRHTLQLMRPDHQQVAIGLEAELDHFVEHIASDEADRGMAAFLGRRQPGMR